MRRAATAATSCRLGTPSARVSDAVPSLSTMAALPGLGGAGQQLDPALQRALASMVESNADQFSEMSGLSVLRNRIHDHAQQRVERLREHGRHYRGPHSTTRTPPPAPSFSRPGAIGRNPASFGLPPPAFQPAWPQTASDRVGGGAPLQGAPGTPLPGLFGGGNFGTTRPQLRWELPRSGAGARSGVPALRPPSWLVAELSSRPPPRAAQLTLPHARRPPGPRSEL